MLKQKIEAVLFASGKPLEIKKIAKLIGEKPAAVEPAVTELMAEKNIDDSGLHILKNENKYQLVSNPALADVVDSLVKDETTGELTKPSLETLTIIAYRGPITKPEIEQIRGINCSVILRNLLMRGLVEERDNAERLQPVYSISNDFMRHMGIASVEDLPRYKELSQSEDVDEVLADLNGESPDQSPNESVSV